MNSLGNRPQYSSIISSPVQLLPRGRLVVIWTFESSEKQFSFVKSTFLLFSNSSKLHTSCINRLKNLRSFGHPECMYMYNVNNNITK